MSAALQILSISVEGWKAIPDDNPVEIDFNGESLLIHGPNESGKSSLFSALRFALFERHDAQGDWTKGWVNNQSNQAAIIVELMVNGKPFTISKFRKGEGAPRGTKSESNLYQGTGKSREEDPIYRGVDAVNEIIRLIGATARSGRADEVPSDWGLLAWLLAPQGMDSVSSAREHGTQFLGLERSMSPDLTSVKMHLKESLKDELSKEKREPKTGGRYCGAIDNETGAKGDCDTLNNRMESHILILQELHRIESEIERKKIEFEQAREEEDRIRGLDVDTASLDGSVKIADQNVSESTMQLETVENRLDALQVIEKERYSRDEDAREALKKITSFTDKKNQTLSELDAAKKERTELDTRLREIMNTITTLLELKNRLRDHDERESQKSNVKRAEEIRDELAELTGDAPALTQDEIENLEGLEEDLRIAIKTLSALATQGSSLTVEGEIDALLIIDGEEISRQDAMVFGQRLEIKGNVYRITVNNATSEDDYVENRTKLMEQLKELGFKSHDELKSKIDSERPRTQKYETLRRDSTELGALDELKAKFSSIPDPKLTEDEMESGPRIQDEIDALKSEEKEKESRVSKLNETVADLEEKIIESRGDLTKVESDEKTANARRKDADERLRAEIEAHGDLGAQKIKFKAAKKKVESVEGEFKALSDQLEQTVSSRSSKFKRANRNKRAKEDELNALRAKHIARKDEAKNIAGENLQSKIVKSEQQLDDAQAQLQRIHRSVEAMERLRLRIEDRITEATDVETAPIRDKVQTWLRTVTEDRWHEIEMDSKLNVTKVNGPGNMAIDGESFGSHGLQQVIHALIRLAVACKIHDDRSAQDPDFPPVALVMDESQSHVDDRRVSLLMERFNREISEGRVQIIALSHRATEFRNLEAREYDMETRSIRDLRGEE